MSDKPVERFDFGYSFYGHPEMQSSETGDYVEFAAYKALKAENEALRKQVAELKTETAKDHVKIMHLKDALSAYGDPDVFADGED